MNTLRLDLDVAYTHQTAPDEAPPHYLAVYLDRSWAGGRSPPAKFTTTTETLEETTTTLVGHWPRHAQVPRDAQICFQATTTTRNSTDVPCQQDCGTVTVNLADTLAQHQKTPGTWVAAPLRVHTTRNHLQKGTVRFRVRSVAVEGASPSVTFGPAVPTGNLTANVNRLLANFNGYLDEYASENDAFRIVYPGTARINCPLTPSEQTVANSQVCMPYAAYQRYEVPAIEPSWWRAQMQIRAARLLGTDDVQVYARHVLQAPVAQQANEWLQLCAQYVQQLPYVSDRTAGQPVEMVRVSIFRVYSGSLSLSALREGGGATFENTSYTTKGSASRVCTTAARYSAGVG